MRQAVSLAGDEVELLHSGWLVEPGPPQPPVKGGGAASGDLVVAVPCRNSRWPSSPARACARRAWSVCSMPDSFSARSAVVQGGADDAHW